MSFFRPAMIVACCAFLSATVNAQSQQVQTPIDSLTSQIAIGYEGIATVTKNEFGCILLLLEDGRLVVPDIEPPVEVGQCIKVAGGFRPICETVATCSDADGCLDINEYGDKCDLESSADPQQGISVFYSGNATLLRNDDNCTILLLDNGREVRPDIAPPIKVGQTIKVAGGYRPICLSTESCPTDGCLDVKEYGNVPSTPSGAEPQQQIAIGYEGTATVIKNEFGCILLLLDNGRLAVPNIEPPVEVGQCIKVAGGFRPICETVETCRDADGCLNVNEYGKACDE